MKWSVILCCCIGVAIGASVDRWRSMEQHLQPMSTNDPNLFEKVVSWFTKTIATISSAFTEATNNGSSGYGRGNENLATTTTDSIFSTTTSDNLSEESTTLSIGENESGTLTDSSADLSSFTLSSTDVSLVADDSQSANDDVFPTSPSTDEEETNNENIEDAPVDAQGEGSGSYSSTSSVEDAVDSNSASLLTGEDEKINGRSSNQRMTNGRSSGGDDATSSFDISVSPLTDEEETVNENVENASVETQGEGSGSSSVENSDNNDSDPLASDGKISFNVNISGHLNLCKSCLKDTLKTAQQLFQLITRLNEANKLVR